MRPKRTTTWSSWLAGSSLAVALAVGMTGCAEEEGAIEEEEEPVALAVDEPALGPEDEVAETEGVLGQDEAELGAELAEDDGLYAPVIEEEGGNIVGRMGFGSAGAAGAVVIERIAPSEVRVGQPYSYRLLVQNTSEYPVHDVLVREITPRAFQYDRAIRNPGEEYGLPTLGYGAGANVPAAEGGAQGEAALGKDMQQQVWHIPMLGPGEERVIEVRGVPRAEGTISSCVTVDYRPALCTQVAVVKPELVLTREIAEEVVYVCDEIPVTYTLTNTGTGTTDAAIITETLPEGFVTETGENAIEIDAGELEPGESIEETVVVSPEAAGEFVGYAVARTGEIEVQSEEDLVRVLDPELELRVRGAEQAYLDRDLGYTITVANTSDAPALDTVVHIERPEGTERWTFSSEEVGAPEDGAFLIGDLAPGETASFDVTFAAVEPGTIATRVVAEAYCVDQVVREVSTEIIGVPAVRLETVDLVDPVPVGETTTYEISVKNQGTAEDVNINVTAQLPPNLEFVEATGDTEVVAEGDTIRFGRIQSLPPNAVATWRVVARAVEPGQVEFKLRLQSDAIQQGVHELEPTNIY